MKKICVFFAALSFSVAAMAEGYQVNTLSAKQSGMGNVGTGMKLGAESMHFNPAGLTSIEGLGDVQVTGNGIISSVEYKGATTSATTDNKMSTPFAAYAGFKIGEKWGLGLAVTTPYGSGLNWGKNWAGAHTVQEIKLQSFSFQPTVAYKITPRLSVGAGLMVMKGSFMIGKGLLPVGSIPEPYVSKGLSPINVNLEGNAKVGLGFNVGAMWDVTDRFTLGVSYRSKVMMKVDAGDASIEYAEGKKETILQVLNASPTTAPMAALAQLMDDSKIKAELPLPSNINVGASYKLTDKWLLAADLQFVGWGTYDSLNIVFNKGQLSYENKNPKKYTSTVAVRLGAEFKPVEKWTVRGGFYYDQTPVDTDYYNPETPGANKFSFTLGGTYSVWRKLDITAAAGYIWGQNKGSIDTSFGKFSGEYKPSALALSLGLGYKF